MYVLRIRTRFHCTKKMSQLPNVSDFYPILNHVLKLSGYIQSDCPPFCVRACPEFINGNPSSAKIVR